MPEYAFFNAFSDFAVAGPWIIEPIKKLSKLIIIHRSKFMPVFAVIQEKNKDLEYWSGGVMEYWKPLRQGADHGNKWSMDAVSPKRNYAIDWMRVDAMFTVFLFH